MEKDTVKLVGGLMLLVGGFVMNTVGGVLAKGEITKFVAEMLVNGAAGAVNK